MTDILIAGIGMTRFARRPESSVKQLAAEAVTAAFDDAGLASSALQSAVVANAGGAVTGGQGAILGQVVLRPLGIGGIPVINVENACAGGSTALHLAWQAVGSGAADVALALGVERISHPDRELMIRSFSSGVDADALPADQSARHTVFMDIYAGLARAFLEEHGGTVADLAQVVVKSRRFGAANPHAQFRGETTVEDVLAAPMVSPPLTRPMCSPIGDGAAAAILMSEAAARRIRVNGPPVRIRASVLRSASLPGEPVSADLAPAAAYAQAGLGPMDLDVAEVHDATAPAELLSYRHLGLCGPGEASKLLRDAATDLGGRIPVNTSGGLLSRGHPVSATGLAQIVELVLQLRGRATGRQVEGARVALAQNAGGYLGNDSAAHAVHILTV